MDLTNVPGAESAVMNRVASASDPLDQLLSEARRELASAESRITRLVERAKEIAARAVQEQNELQRFLEEFALEPAVYQRPAERRDRGTGPLFDIEAMRAGALELGQDVLRSTALHSNLEATLHTIQACYEHATPDRAFTPVQDTTDLRLQQAMSEAREDERRRLAREVHDGPAQVLTNAIYGVQIAEQVAKRAPDLVAEELARVRDLLKDGVTEVRRFMFDLRPTMLQDHGLEPTLRRYVDDHNRFFGKHIHFLSSGGVYVLTPEQELTVFRIVQEALQNIHKHAGPKAGADVALVHANGWLALTIADTGRGFDPDGIVRRPGVGSGLPGMRERAKLAGAELNVVSTPGSGTTVSFKMRLSSQTGPLGRRLSGETE